MTLTPPEARAAAEKWLAENRPGKIAKLYEDSTDSLVELSGPARIDGTFLFIRKSDGSAWEAVPAEVLDKVFAMDEL